MRIGGSIRAMIPPAGDELSAVDLPIFDGAPPRSVEFAPRAVRPPGRRGPVIAGAWAMAIIGLVGVGLLATEQVPDEGQPQLADAGPPADAGPLAVEGEPRPPDIELPSTRMGALLVTGHVVELHSPAPARAEITTKSLEVAGTLLVRAARVRISLRARDNRVLDHVTVDVSDPDGGIRPARTPTFAATFELPFPRPNGSMWVVVTAYDEGGLPLGSIRRSFEVGPLVAPPVPRTYSKPMSESWLPWRPAPALAAPPPACQLVSPILASRC